MMTSREDLGYHSVTEPWTGLKLSRSVYTTNCVRGHDVSRSAEKL
jgi:hypothetical protein